MHLIAIGGDLRMDGLVSAARRAGFDCRHVNTLEALGENDERMEAIVLPWPKSFTAQQLSQTQIAKAELLERLPACTVLMGGGLDAKDFPRAERIFDPLSDETLLTVNAKLTAEGAVAAFLGSHQGALMGKTCLITGFGRIAQALTRRLAAMEMFVIVCARNEGQMQLAHRMGAHPVPLRQLASACLNADFVINTVPARVLTGEALAQMKPGARLVELASAPYGADPQQAAKLGVSMEILGGLPGKYAPQEAGAALFDALQRAMKKASEEEGV